MKDPNKAEPKFEIGRWGQHHFDVYETVKGKEAAIKAFRSEIECVSDPHEIRIFDVGGDKPRTDLETEATQEQATDSQSKLAEWEASGYEIVEEGDPDSFICGDYETGTIYAEKDGERHLIGGWGPMSHENSVKSITEISGSK